MMTQVDVPNPLTAPAEVERQASEVTAIRRMLHASQGTFSLSIAVCNSPALRDYLIGQLRADFPAIQVISIPKGTIDVFGHVAGTTGGDPPQALFLVDLEASTPSADESQATLRSLNASRDLWESRYRCPVVLWLPEFAATLLCERARDFWRYRSHGFEFVSELAAAHRGVADAFGGAPSAVAGLSAEEKQFRIAELEQRIAEARERPGDDLSRYVSEWLSELALLHQFLGDLDQAERLLREALEIDERLGDVRSRALTMGQIADVLQDRGELDEALRIRREDELPVYERLGDVRARAVTMGRIADILEARGELDEALRIRREDQLPVYERLGDVRERALTMGRIADVLQARGELDEALRIRREDELPVYERLGDVRSRAVTMGQIADVLQARGELDEALRIRREDELPVYERLGDVRSRAVTMGLIADVLQARGELDEALRIRREDQLPVYERLGDVRERALTMGRIADVLQARGELDEALRIRREDELPVYERLGDRRALLVGRTNLAIGLVQRGGAGDREEAKGLLRSALEEARNMRIPEAGKIAGILERLGEAS